MRATQMQPASAAYSASRHHIGLVHGPLISHAMAAWPGGVGQQRREPVGFFERAIGTVKVIPVEVITDRAATYPIVLDELLPAPWHRTDRNANNHVEADHGRLKSRLRPMCGFKQDHSAKVVTAGHAFVQNLRRGHFELAVEEPVNRRVAVALDELAMAI
jgi:DDE domain